jgi:hypothetical protein
VGKIRVKINYAKVLNNKSAQLPGNIEGERAVNLFFSKKL